MKKFDIFTLAAYIIFAIIVVAYFISIPLLAKWNIFKLPLSPSEQYHTTTITKEGIIHNYEETD